MTWARLAFRLQRSSIGFAALLCLGLAGLAAWLTVTVQSTLALCEGSAAQDHCGTVYLFGSPMGEPVMLTQMAIGVAMYAAPLVLGVPLLTQEIERRTAMIAWPLAGSRLKWLAWRAGSVLVVGLLLIGLMAFAAESMAAASQPDTDLGFFAHGVRGISLMTRAALMLVVAVALGAVIGRLLPSLLIGIALAVALSTAIGMLPPYGVVSTEITPTEVTATDAFFEGGHPLQTGHAFRGPDGRLMTNDEAEVLILALIEEHSPGRPPESEMPTDVLYGISGSRYFEVLARESALLVGASLVVAGVAAAVVQRRRPE